jgi:tRNA uridine 5-carboxymethylaminomethyl modification enzyme
VNQDGVVRSAGELLGGSGIGLDQLSAYWPELRSLAPEIAEQIAIDAMYAGYLQRQDDDIRTYRADEALRLPDGLDYLALTSLSMEVRQKLAAARPATIGQAARISGVTPAALTILLRHARRNAA